MRYRSYYFDNESGYYYLQSRYYDSNTCRFINADESSVLELTKGQAVGHNLSAYCGNDPINNVDPTGKNPAALAGLYFITGIGEVLITITLATALAAIVAWIVCKIYHFAKKPFRKLRRLVKQIQILERLLRNLQKPAIGLQL